MKMEKLINKKRKEGTEYKDICTLQMHGIECTSASYC